MVCRFRSVLIVSLILLILPSAAIAVPEGLTLSWPGGGAGQVVFDGTVHAKKGLTCDACHVAGVFHTRKGADPITMDANKKQQYCGTCHNAKRAFSTTDPQNCGRCHQGYKKAGSDRPATK